MAMAARQRRLKGAVAAMVRVSALPAEDAPTGTIAHCCWYGTLSLVSGQHHSRGRLGSSLPVYRCAAACSGPPPPPPLPGEVDVRCRLGAGAAILTRVLMQVR